MRARLMLFPMDEGGKKAPIFTGYRPSFRSGTVDLGVAVVTFDGADMMLPGTEGDVALEPIVLGAWLVVTPGATLDVFEEEHRVGTATVLPE
jgi:translation elongation factor EF-Tu-like GTPase